MTARSSQTLFLYHETGGEEGEADPQTTEHGNPIPGLDVEEEEEINTPELKILLRRLADCGNDF